MPNKLKRPLDEQEQLHLNQFIEEMALRPKQVQELKKQCQFVELSSPVKSQSHTIAGERGELFDRYKDIVKDEVTFYSQIEKVQNRIDDLFDLEEILKQQGLGLDKAEQQERDKLEDQLYEISENYEGLFHDDNNLINKYSIGDDAFLVLSGELKTFVIKHERDGKNPDSEVLLRKEFAINLHGPGELIGEISIILNTLRTAFVAPTVTPSTLIQIPKSVFKQWQSDNPDFNNALLRLMSKRVIHLTQNSESLALDQMYDRLKRLLPQRLARQKEATQEFYIPADYSHAAIAEHVGTTRTNITMLFSKLVKKGAIRIEKDGTKVLVGTLPDTL